MIIAQCPFCTNINLFQTVRKQPETDCRTVILNRLGKEWNTLKNAEKLKTPPDCRDKPFEAKRHGNFWLIVIDDSFFPTGWKGFKIEVLGLDIPNDPDLEFLLPPTLPLLIYEIGARRVFFACRVTKKGKGTAVILHWWPSHGDLLVIQGYMWERGSTKDFDEIVKESVRLLGTVNESGRKKGSKTTASKKGARMQRNLSRIKKACQEFFGDSKAPAELSQRELASLIGISSKTLDRWYKELDLNHEEVVSRAFWGDKKMKL